MEISGKSVIVTGGGSGIGKAMCHAFRAAGAKGIIVADLDKIRADAVAADIDGIAVRCDVTKEAEIQSLVAMADFEFGGVDIFCSNAGAGFFDGGPNCTDADNGKWQLSWELHVMAHVYAARAALPGMIERGGGYFVQTVSAAGILSQIGDAAYSTTKHAAIGFAESLAITHGDQGIRVSALCPQYVATNLLGIEGQTEGLPEGVLTPDVVAQTVIDGIAAEQFLILPHPVVADYRANKYKDYDRWIGGMRKLRRSIAANGQMSIDDLHKAG